MVICSKLAVLNKAIQGTFFKSQKSRNRLKTHINYRFFFTLRSSGKKSDPWHFFKSQKIKKKYMEITDPYLLVT